MAYYPPPGPMGYQPQQQAYYPPPQQQQQMQPQLQYKPGFMTEQQLIGLARSQGGLFSDHEFQPGQKALGKHEDGVVWLRPPQIANAPQLFIDGSSEGDVVQGALGDCWFLGALAVVATRMDLIKQLLISIHPELGFYQFRFYKDGEWQVVTIDDQIPCVKSADRSNPKGYRPIYARCKDANEFWVPLIEKAYAKLHGSYLLLESGWTGEGFVDLTGGCNELVSITESRDGKFDYMGGIWGIVKRCHDEGWLLGSSSEGGREVDSGMGILTGHAYSIIDCREVQQYNLKLLRVRNPWGKKEWTGRWSDNSGEWNPYYEQLFNYKRDANDGTFWMQLEDFQRHYTRLFVCRLYSDAVGQQYFRYMLHGEWRGSSAGGSSNNESWKNNPQFGLTVNEPCNVCISLTQQDVRMMNNSRDEYHIGFGVFKTSNNTQRKARAAASEQVCKTGSFVPKREVLVEWNFTPGQYVIVPATYDPGLLAKFTVVVFAAKQIAFHAIRSDGSIEATSGNPLDQVTDSFAAMKLGEPVQGHGYTPPTSQWGAQAAAPPPSLNPLPPQQQPYAAQAAPYQQQPQAAYQPPPSGGYGAPAAASYVPPAYGGYAPPPDPYAAGNAYGAPPNAYGAPPASYQAPQYGGYNQPPAPNYGYQQPPAPYY